MSIYSILAMIDTKELFLLIEQMALFIVAGIIVNSRVKNKDGFIDGITELLVDIVLPCSIIEASSLELTAELISKTKAMFVVSIAVQAVCYVIARLAGPLLSDDCRAPFQYGLIGPNNGALGVAIISGLLGSEGLLLASIFLLPQRIMMWTLGVNFYTSENDTRRAIRKVLSNPCVISLFISMAILALQIVFPPWISKPISVMSSCQFPLSMVLVGLIISKAKLHDFIRIESWVFSFIRLLAIPCAMLLFGRLAGLNIMVLAVAVLSTAMPGGTVNVILSSKYHKNEEFAASTVTVSTILFIFSIPLWCSFF